jgi:hypothetical protein
MARLAGLYQSSGMGRGEFCRSHGLSLSTLARHLSKGQSAAAHGRRALGTLARQIRLLYRSASTQPRKIVVNYPNVTLFDPNQNVSFAEN